MKIESGYQIMNHMCLIFRQQTFFFFKLRIWITGVRMYSIRKFLTWSLENGGHFKIFTKGGGQKDKVKKGVRGNPALENNRF